MEVTEGSGESELGPTDQSVPDVEENSGADTVSSTDIGDPELQAALPEQLAGIGNEATSLQQFYTGVSVTQSGLSDQGMLDGQGSVLDLEDTPMDIEEPSPHQQQVCSQSEPPDPGRNAPDGHLPQLTTDHAVTENHNEAFQLNAARSNGSDMHTDFRVVDGQATQTAAVQAHHQGIQTGLRAETTENRDMQTDRTVTDQQFTQTASVQSLHQVCQTEGQSEAVTSEHRDSQTDRMVTDQQATQTSTVASHHQNIQTEAGGDAAKSEHRDMQTDNMVTDQQSTQTAAVQSQHEVCQTEAKAEENRDMQTDATVTEQQATQTSVASQHQVCQTEDKKAELESRHMQTVTMVTDQQATQTSVESHHQVSQTEAKSEENRDMQTDATVTDQQATQTSVDSQHQLSQTDERPCADGSMQTEQARLAHSFMQTTILEYSQTESQTDKAKLDDRGTDPEPHPVLDTDTQTQTSMALEREMECQAVVDTEQFGSQTEVSCEERESQTEVANRDTQCQTEKDEKDQHVQVQPDVKLCEMQTDMSMANQTESASQVEVDVEEREVQATVEHSCSEIQTDSSMALLEEQAVQTFVPEMFEMDSQTESVQSSHRCVQTTIDTKTSVSQTESPLHNSQGIQTEDIPAPPSPQAVQPQPVEGEPTVEVNATAVEAPAAPTKPLVCDSSSQTDPVTIIIGDASFLMKKIKSSAVSPSKITSSGNEIEIEVQAEGENAEPQFAEPEYQEQFQQQQSDDLPAQRKPGPKPKKRSSTPYVEQPIPQVDRTKSARRMPVTYSRLVNPDGQSNAQNQRTEFEEQSPVVIQPNWVAGDNVSVDYVQSSGGPRGKYSCPFCTETFHESPTLYEHLQETHQVECSRVKKPKGREGKTILPKKPTTSFPNQPMEGEPQMPVLMPVLPIQQKNNELRDETGLSASAATAQVVQHVHQGELENAQQVVEESVVEEAQEPVLFEDDTQAVQRKQYSMRHRSQSAPQTGEEDDAGVATVVAAEEEVGDEGVEVLSMQPGKRRHTSLANPAKRRRRDNEDEVEGEDQTSRVTRRSAAEMAKVKIQSDDPAMRGRTRKVVLVKK